MLTLCLHDLLLSKVTSDWAPVLMVTGHPLDQMPTPSLFSTQPRLPVNPGMLASSRSDLPLKVPKAAKRVSRCPSNMGGWGTTPRPEGNT
jgi:hypothetical protein